MRIRIVSVPVPDLEKALKFYTEKLGFIKKRDIPLGEGNRWVTLVSAEEPDGAEILLEPAPTNFEPSKVFQKALFDAGIPCAQFDADNVEEDYQRLVELGVEFSVKPTVMGTWKFAVFNDTCGNHIEIFEEL